MLRRGSEHTNMSAGRIHNLELHASLDWSSRPKNGKRCAVTTPSMSWNKNLTNGDDDDGDFASYQYFSRSTTASEQDFSRACLNWTVRFFIFFFFLGFLGKATSLSDGISIKEKPFRVNESATDGVKSRTGSGLGVHGTSPRAQVGQLFWLEPSRTYPRNILRPH